jgi:CheY-like chemotaxis protein
MSKSIIFFDKSTNLINPNDQEFIDNNLVEIFITNDKSIDEEITRIITENLLEKEYMNILIPACFGGVLSDFLGLRFATHIRCTLGINQTANILLYSFTGVQDYFSNECFNILKTNGVNLIDYNIQSIINSTLIDKKKLSTNDLINQVKKLKIDVPLNYEDSHSIANEWAIYKWSNTIGATDGEIVKIESKLENDLYFKYLKTIYPISDFETLNSNELKLKFEGNPTVLYIDDEAEKGWKEIFEKILIDENDIEFLPVGNELNEKSKKEIIEFSLKQVIEEDVDVVVLDFRLHKEDFEDIPIQDITGYQILKKIKEYNKGIEVIIFSATNKIWNLQALQEAGADGFILKESPENSVEDGFTLKCIENLVHVFNSCFERNFLKAFHLKIDELKTELLPRKNFKKVSNPLDKNFVDEVLKWLYLSCELLAKNLNTASKTSSFLFLFSVLENLSNQIVNSEPIKIDNHSDIYYEFEFSRVTNRLVFFKENRETGEYTRTNNKLRASKPGISWAQKILNTLDYLNAGIGSELDLNEIIGKRNNIIHANSSLKGKLEISNKELINLFNIVYNGLKMI